MKEKMKYFNYPYLINMTNSIDFSINELTERVDFNIDLLICSSSFETRCITIPRQLKEFNIGQIVICHYEENYSIANDNLDVLLAFFPSAEKLTFHKNNPLFNLDILVTQINSYKKKRKKLNSKSSINILIDITTFTHEMILILVYLFKTYLKSPEYTLKLAYTPAAEYSTDFKNEEEKWLSKGVGEIRTVLGYPGELIPSKKNLLIILVGYEEERIKSMVDLFEPAKVLLGHASKEGAISQDLLGKNVITYQSLMRSIVNSLGIDVETFEFTCKQPSEVLDIFDTIISSYAEMYNLIVCCLNNKISTIGCALAGIKYPQIQICYPTAKQYNYLNYSTPSQYAYLIEI
jgi:hypothetical protein